MEPQDMSASPKNFRLVDPDDLDRPIYGARNIAIAAGVLDKNGEPKVRAAFHLLQAGHLPADKVGGRWPSPPRLPRALPPAERARIARPHRRPRAADAVP